MKGAELRDGTVTAVHALRLSVLLLALPLVLSAQSVPTLQREATDMAAQLYQDGDYVGAVEAYEGVLAAGFESDDLFYNLGNAYFKSGELGRSILNWERALVRTPGDADAIANLELASQLTVDVVDPLPRFWLLSVASWILTFIPRSLLIFSVSLSWVALTVGGVSKILARGGWVASFSRGLVLIGGAAFLVLGTDLALREIGVGQSHRAVILAEAVPVRAAPADDDDLILFEIHEGTRVRIDQQSGEWAEVVLDDGKVGWVRIEVMAVI
jgi:tetratricopeptide (TPR) repeat protein